MENLETIAIKLKNEACKYDPVLFSKRIIALINGITHPWMQNSIKGLVSPWRQLLYLLNLNLTSPKKEKYTEVFSESKDWPIFIDLLNQMNLIHELEYGEFKEIDENLANSLEKEEIYRRRTIGVSTYNAFFHQGPLNFEEQGIEKLIGIFKNLNADLFKNFGWNSNHFINLYNDLDRIREQKHDDVWSKDKSHPPISKEEFKENYEREREQGASFREAMRNAMQTGNEFINYQIDPSVINVFTLADLSGFNGEFINNLIDNLMVSRKVDESFLYFNQPNQIIEKPILKIDNKTFIVVDYKLLLDAFFNFLQKKSLEVVKKTNRIFEARDKYLENKVHKLFEKFYSNDKHAKIFPSYYVDGEERDLLILTKNTALIIESKAGNVREPMFDADKAFKKIDKNFDDIIDYGYQQAFSVKLKFIEKVTFEIKDGKNKVLEVINTKAYKNVFTIVVTYNKFGHVQNDLWLMLRLFDEDNSYPWSVCIDDLEIFLLAMKKLNLSYSDFYRFLSIREKLHGNLIENDEGRVLGHFLNKKRIIPKNGFYMFSPDDAVIFDKLYSTGLGFKNERGMDRKSDPRYLKIY